MRWILVLFTFISLSANAGELELYGGANSTTYDDASDANTWGVSLRMQYNFKRADDTWFLNWYAPGLGPLASEIAAGYAWKTQGDFFLEGGIGGSYSLIWGPFPLVVAGFGYRISQNVFFDFPIMLGNALVWMPYLGISF